MSEAVTFRALHHIYVKIQFHITLECPLRQHSQYTYKRIPSFKKEIGEEILIENNTPATHPQRLLDL